MPEPERPGRRPRNPCFSSGPCAKRPGWSPEALNRAVVGRSHRSGEAKARIAEVIERSRALLGVPDEWRLGIVPASDTGAFEMAMWSLLGARGADVLAWESFGQGWVTDIRKQLKLDDVRVLEAPYGALPDLAAADFSRDVVFTWNGTTSGARLPDGDWIAADRDGLTLCDATSAAFAVDLPWDKLDVVTYSWQKVMGGEAQHGILILSPRAVERLETHTPPWPMPKLFRLTKGGKLNESIFEGATINTPSMLAVEDALDGLTWAEGIGGLPALVSRADLNAAAIDGWLGRTAWIDHLVAEPRHRSNTSVCLKIVDSDVAARNEAAQRDFVKALCARLEREGVAYDINAYRDAPPGLRLWAGATVERDDLEALFPWLDWAFETVKREEAAHA